MKKLWQKAITTTLSLAVLTLPALAQSKRIPISIIASDNDGIGQRFVYELKEELNRSTIFQYSAATDTGLYLSIVSQSERPDRPQDNYSSAVSVVLFGRSKGQLDWFITHWVLQTQGEQANYSANLLSQMSNTIDLVDKAVSSLPPQPPQAKPQPPEPAKNNNLPVSPADKGASAVKSDRNGNLI